MLICLLAYYVEWHMRRALAPVLFDDQNPGQRPASPVAPAQRSVSAQRKAQRKRNSHGLPVQSFQDWLRNLATITKNHVQPKIKSIPAFEVITRRTAAQQRALELVASRSDRPTVVIKANPLVPANAANSTNCLVGTGELRSRGTRAAWARDELATNGIEGMAVAKAK